MSLPIVGKVIDGVSGFFKKREERKIAKITGMQKIQQAQEDHKNSLNLTDAEWEVAKVRTEETTWKDEFVTVVITSPIWLILLASVLSTFGVAPGLLNGVVGGIVALQSLGVDMGFLMEAVVLAAVGLKTWRKAIG